jgi:predicted ATPase
MKILIEAFRNIVDKILFEVEKNKLTCLIGNNGVGKSNLLRAIDSFNFSYRNQSVSFTSNFVGDEEKLVNSRRVDISFKLSEIDKNTVNKLLKKIGIQIDEKHEYEWNQVKNVKGKVQKSSDLNHIYAEIHKQKKEIIGDKYLYKEGEKTHLNYEVIRKALVNKSLQNKDAIIPILKVILEINEIFSRRIKTFLIENADSEFDLEHLCDILDFENDDENGRKVKELLYFIGNDSIDDAKTILLVNAQSNIDESKIERAKKRIIDKANEKIKSIFKYFDLYGIPNVSFDGTQISISIDFDKNTLYGETIDLSRNSSGYRSLLHFLIKFDYVINYSKNDNTECILMVDELDKNIHPILQLQLLKYINSKIENSNLYFIISTHSPFLIETNGDMSNFYVLTKNVKGNLEIGEKNKVSSDLISSFLVLSNKVLNSHDFLMQLGENKIILLENANDDDIMIIKQTINKRVSGVIFKTIKTEDVLKEDINVFVDNANDLDSIFTLLNDNKKILVKEEVVKKLRESE